MAEVDETKMEAPQETPEQPASEAVQETAPEKQLSKRDAFRERYAKRNPDLDMDNEDEYYSHIGKTMDELEKYEENSRRLRESMDKSPAMAEMIVAAQKQDEFDPVVWMVQQKGLDLQAAQEDPEYAKKLADARASYMEKQAKSDEISKNMAENMPKSVEEIRAKAEELGLDDAQTEEIVGQMFQIMDDLVNGKISVDIFALLAKGKTRDADVEAAREEGVAAGLDTKVDDKLRTLEAKKEHIAGAQTPMRTPAPKKRERNMFLAGDEDY